MIFLDFHKTKLKLRTADEVFDYIISNLQWVHKTVNVALKQTLDIKSVQQWANKIVEHNR